MAYTVKSFFEIFSEEIYTGKLTRLSERYFNWSMEMDNLPELIGNKEFKSLLIRARKVLFEDKEDKEEIIAMNKIYRKSEKPAKEQYWWWLEKL